MIEFLASVYGVLVLGETLASDGSILTPPLTNSSTPSNGSTQGHGQGQASRQKAGPGFGSMSQWQGGNQKVTHSGNGSDRDLNSVNGGGHKKERQAEIGTELSDFPRKVSD